MTQHDGGTRLRHMPDAAQEALALIEGKPRSEVDSDRVLSSAIVRLREIVGEAANHVSESLRLQHPNIPWADIVGLRNRLIHGYDSIDMDVLWQVLNKDLPVLTQQLRVIGTDL